MVSAVAVILLSVANIAIASMMVVLARRLRRQSDEITELQALVDMLLLKVEGRSYFADRYDIDYVKVVDPTKLLPPEVS